VEVAKILRHLPDGEQINRKIYQNIARSVEDAVRSAKTQITDTEEILSLTGSAGFLVLLNDGIDVLSPPVVVRRMSELLCRRRTNDSAHTSIDFVWLLFESHVTHAPDNSAAHPSVLLEGPTASAFKWFGTMFDQLQTSWANFNTSPLIHSSVERITEIAFRATSTERAVLPEKLKRHEQWERQYEAAPYLRSFSNDEVLAHGVQAFKVLRPYFLDGGPRLSMDQLEPFFIKWSDFLRSHGIAV
jgi:hypothetical protein